MGIHSETVKELFSSNKRVLIELFPSFKEARNNYQKTSIVIDGVTEIKSNLNEVMKDNDSLRYTLVAERDAAKEVLDNLASEQKKAKKALDAVSNANESIKDFIDQNNILKKESEEIHVQYKAGIEMSDKYKQLIEDKKDLLKSTLIGYDDKIKFINKIHDDLVIENDQDKRRRNIFIGIAFSISAIEAIALFLI